MRRVSLLIFSLLVLFGAFSYRSVLHRDSRTHLTAIVQTSSTKEALKTTYLAELLDLSIESPISIYEIDLKKARKKLLRSPLIASAIVKRLPPDRLYIEYEVRQPIALLGDYANIGVDREGYLFPLTPFFTPKALPELYLGLPPFESPEDSLGRKGGSWHEPLSNRYFRLSLEILDKCSYPLGDFSLKRIDVSNAFSTSLGKREIVLVTEEMLQLGTSSYLFPKMVRLHVKNIDEELVQLEKL